MRRARLIVAGEQRSGTTLLTDLLNAQPLLEVGTGVLTRALRAARAMRLRPLDRLTESQRLELAGALRRGLSGSRRTTEFDAGALHTLADVVTVGLDIVRRSGPGDAMVAGSKDHEPPSTLAPLLGLGVHVIYIVRDARDVALSRAHRGETDLPRSLVAWRQSVEEALALRHRHFHLIRFETLVRDPVQTFADLAAAFDWPLDPDAVTSWRLPESRLTNSSFGVPLPTVDLRPVERWRAHQDDPIVRHACTVCAPELAALGYAAGPAISARERAQHRVTQAYFRTRRRAGKIGRGVVGAAARRFRHLTAEA